MKTTRDHGRRQTHAEHPKQQSHGEKLPLTVGDLISAAYDTLHETGAVVRVLASNRMANHIGRKLVFL